ncbi:MAG: LLM class oxidoreductase [Bacteroidota bacterium]
MKAFASINAAYDRVFTPGQLSIGVVVPIENYETGSLPSMHRHLERVRLIEALGYQALWLRDVPLHVPSFGDAGQTYDPFAYLGYLAGQTHQIALGIASIALPLHHPVHVAKAAATIDQLSGGRLILGVASGDRFQEYPALGLDYEQRGAQFRAAFDYLRRVAESFPSLRDNSFGRLDGTVDVLPKPMGPRLPLLITGHSRQTLEWNAEHGDGWLYYPRNLHEQAQQIRQWRSAVEQFHDHDKPFLQPLYIDLAAADDALPQPIHLGFRLGLHRLVEYFEHLRAIGVNHVALNLRFNTGAVEATLEHLATHLLPQFHHPLQPDVST